MAAERHDASAGSGNDNDMAADGDEPGREPEQPAGKGWRFWMIFPPLCVATLLIAFESTVTSTALPTISAVLHAGDEYTWYANAYLLTSTAVLPLWGQFAMVYGRRWPIMVAVGVFMIGSGVSGGANNSATMIAGRAVQGVGGGGVNVLTQLIVSDLVSVRERGKYMGIIFSVFGVGTSLGPVVGGLIVQHGGTDSWRWVFWLNLPICAVTLVLQLIFLQLTYKELDTFKERMQQIDWVGNGLLTGSIISICIALSWADTRYGWSDWHILFPLILGFAGWAVFHFWEASRWCRTPTIAPVVFSTRTSFVGMVLTFFQSMLTYWIIYFLPVYFQAVLEVSPGRSGVLLLPSVLIGIPAAIIAGSVLSMYGRYKPIHLVSFGIMTAGVGMFINLDSGSSLAKIVLYQVVAGLGGGGLLVTMLPAIQANLPPSVVSVTTSTWEFIRAFGYIWGIAIPTSIFNSRASKLLPNVADPAVRLTLGGGDAYSHFSQGYVKSLDPVIHEQVIDVYTHVLRTLWEVCVAMTGVCVLLVLLEKEVTMRTEVEESDFKLKEKKPQSDVEK